MTERFFSHSASPSSIRPSRKPEVTSTFPPKTPRAGAGPQLQARDHEATVAAGLNLLIVDADQPVLKACGEIAAGMGFEVAALDSTVRARDYIESHSPDVVLMDLKMSSGGLSLLEDIRKRRPRCSVVIMTAFATVTSAVEAIRLGAADYLTKPFAMDELTSVLERAAQRRSLEVETKRIQEHLQTHREGTLIGISPEVQKLHRIVQKVATASHPVLILGESGTGKEAIARAIHAAGPHSSKRFHTVDCTQLSPAMLESEVFGYVRNPLTGESREKAGALTQDEGGTLFLGGIRGMSLELQSKLLRALQDRKVQPAGAALALPVTVRVLAGSDGDLSALVDQGQFRKDLFYRLNVVSLRIPPLRERKQDISLLAEYFLERMRREGAVDYRLSADAMQVLMNHAWPGNVSELEICIENTCTNASGPYLHVGDLPVELQGAKLQTANPATVRVDARTYQDPASGQVQDDRRAPVPIVSIADLERDAILHTIRQLKGDKLMAAKLLGIGKTTLYRKLKEYGISD